MTGGYQQPRVIDIFGALPSSDRVVAEIRSWGSDPGYRGLFGKKWASFLGLPEDVCDDIALLEDTADLRATRERINSFLTSVDRHVSSFAAAGVRLTVLHSPLPIALGSTNDDLAELVGPHPDSLVGFVRIDPTDGRKAAAEIHRCVERYGFRGVTVTPFWHRLAANEPEYQHVYETCAELDIPIWVHTSVHWVRSTPLKYEHPLILDEVAARFPETTFIAGHGGWPWVADMVAVAWRHPNVYVDTSAFRARHLAVAGAGWETLWYFMQRGLQDKVLFGSTWTLFGRPIASVIDEAADLPLDDAVRDKWLYGNAAALLGLEQAVGSKSAGGAHA